MTKKAAEPKCWRCKDTGSVRREQNFNPRVSYEQCECEAGKQARERAIGGVSQRAKDGKA